MSLKHLEIYERLVSNEFIGVADHEIILNEEGLPINYRFTDLNTAFERLVGIEKSKMVGKTIKEIIPDIEDKWIELFGEITQKGVEKYFEMYIKPIDKCFKVHAYSYEIGRFVTLIIDATEEYMNKKHLNEEVLRNNMAARSAKIAFFKYDYDTNTQVVSDFWYELFGATEKNKNILTYFWNNIHPEDKKSVEELFEKIVEHEECQCEFRFYHGISKKYIWVRKTAILINNQDLKPTMLLGIYQDINQQKLAQDEIKKLAQMLEIGIKNGGIDVWDYDVKTDRITFRSYIDEYNLSRESNEQFTLAEHITNIHREDVALFLQEINRIRFLGKNSFLVKYRVYSARRNKTIWMKSTGKVIEYDDEGNVLRAVGISQDISSSVENEQNIIKNQKRLQQAQKIAHLGGWDYDFEQETIFLSDEALQILGFSYVENEYTLMRLEEIIGEEQMNRFRGFSDGLLLNDQYEEEFFMHFSQGVKKIHVIATKNYDDNGKIISIIGTLQDITERNLLEERLRQAEKMTAVGQLAGGIAHDFNNILMAASGYAELIKLKSQDATINEYCNKILYSVRSSADLTKKLLAFSRKDSLFKNHINVHECICNAFEILSMTIDKKISFELDFIAEKDIVLADATELQNVFINLCLNSRDAMPNGGNICISTSNATIIKENCQIEEFILETGNYIKIEVSDNGFGINKSIIKNIFEPFFTTKEVGKGTGLGLAAIYGTIVSHNGSISVHSILGEGTTFAIMLPLSSDINDDVHK
ncbi:MAG: hypothetical protein CVU84_05090 [Firmicutes bacterium HGW-Firmicutes-1]|jgi:signal transduction histidine kinase|nr:MAG: hypothetical protein CVU84_05090 [Firmicutes bacterium HGW-Firmicutes-1]